MAIAVAAEKKDRKNLRERIPKVWEFEKRKSRWREKLRKKGVAFTLKIIFSILRSVYDPFMCYTWIISRNIGG